MTDLHVGPQLLKLIQPDLLLLGQTVTGSLHLHQLQQKYIYFTSDTIFFRTYWHAWNTKSLRSECDVIWPCRCCLRCSKPRDPASLHDSVCSPLTSVLLLLLKRLPQNTTPETANKQCMWSHIGYIIGIIIFQSKCILFVVVNLKCVRKFFFKSKNVPAPAEGMRNAPSWLVNTFYPPAKSRHLLTCCTASPLVLR